MDAVRLKIGLAIPPLVINVTNMGLFDTEWTGGPFLLAKPPLWLSIFGGGVRDRGRGASLPGGWHTALQVCQPYLCVTSSSYDLGERSTVQPIDRPWQANTGLCPESTLYQPQKQTHGHTRANKPPRQTHTHTLTHRKISTQIFPLNREADKTHPRAVLLSCIKLW